MSQNLSSGRRDMTGEVRFRVPIVIVLPIVALLLIGLGTFGFSRILLALEGGAATTLAIVMAANVLGACTFVALRPDTARRRWPELVAVLLYPILIGIAIVATGAFGEEESAVPAEAPEGGGGAAAGGGTIVASGIAFETEEITTEAGAEVTGTLVNEDTVDHNIAFYNSEDETSDPSSAFYTSPDAAGGAEAEFSFDAPDEPGDYPFVCDYHPTTMTGTLVVEAGGGGGGGGGEGSQDEGGG